MAQLPDSYETLSLPAVRLSHHPPSSREVTPIILVILNRPAQKNAFNTDMITSLERAFNLLSVDPRVKCIVLTGSDPANKIFCAGMDLSFSSSGRPQNDSSANDNDAQPPDAVAPVSRDTHRDGGGRVSLAIFRCQKPVIAAMNGSAVGVGVTMTLPCAIRVTHRDAKIGFVFARRGLVLEATSSFFLPRLLGTSRALHLVTTGAVYPASDPLLDGLFTLVDDKDNDDNKGQGGGGGGPAAVLPRALAIADEVVRNCSAVSAVVMRDMIYRNPGTPEEAHLLESRMLFDMFRGRDFVEGVRSFVEKRDPVLKGTVPQDAPSAWPWWEDKLKAPKARI